MDNLKEFDNRIWKLDIEAYERYTKLLENTISERQRSHIEQRISSIKEKYPTVKF